MEMQEQATLEDSGLEVPEMVSFSGVQPRLDAPAVADDDIPDDGEVTDFDNLPSEVQERILWAEQLHAAGLHIVPVRAGAKEATAVVDSGLTTTAYIRSYLSRQGRDGNYPNFGARAGDHSVWIDLDQGLKRGEMRTGIANFLKLVEENGELPDTRMVKTRSGGLHLLFKVPYPVTNKDAHLPQWVDVRGRNGYVVGCGCRITEGDHPGIYQHVRGSLDQIADAPDWLLERLRPWSAVDDAEVRKIATGDYRIHGDPAPYHGVRAALAWIDFTMNGGTDDQDTWIGITKALYFNQLPIYRKDPYSAWYDRIDDQTAQELCHDAMSGRLWGERVADPYFEFETYGSPHVLERRIKDGPRRTNSGMTLGSIFRLAKSGGWCGRRSDKYVPHVAIREE
jgi:Bifunctional DNA primase/polymerase, N-terminal